MSQYVYWIEHKGKKILFSNYANIGSREDEYLKAIEETKQELLNCTSKVILTLTDVTGSWSTPATMAKAKELTAVIGAKGVRGASATVGMSGAKKLMAQMLRPDMYFAASIEDAKEWLVKHADDE